MSFFRTVMCCTVLLLFFCSSESKQSAPKSRARDERAIQNIENAVSQAIAAKDLDRLVSLYADDAGLYNENTPTIRGKNAIRESWHATFARPEVNIVTEPRTVEISDNGNLAWGHGLLTMTMKGNAGEPVTEQWEYALVYVKPAGGEWKITADTIYSCIRNHLIRRPQKSSSPLAAIAPLIGLACFLCRFRATSFLKLLSLC